MQAGRDWLRTLASFREIAMDVWTFNWLFWVAGFFLAYELYAALTGQRTLSEQTWNWFSLGQRKQNWMLRRAVFVVFWVALGIHFVFQAPAMWSVILPGIPFAAVIVLSSFVWKDATTSVQKEQPMPESVKLAPEYDWKKTLWKGLRPALVAGGTAALAALVQSVDAQWLVALGVPAFLATFAWEALRNYLKQHRV